MKKLALFISSLVLFFVSIKVVSAQVYQDYRADYREVPVYQKTAQFLTSRNGNNSTIFLRQNLNASAESVAYIIPFGGNNASAGVPSFDPWNELLDKYILYLTYAAKTVDYKIPPKFYTSETKDDFFKELNTQGIDVTELYRGEINKLFDEGKNILLIVVNPVSESRITWTKPVKIDITQENLSLPILWLRKDYGVLTTEKNKIIYAENFEGGNSGWLDDYQGPQANSQVTRVSEGCFSGSYCIKVLNNVSNK